jgi:threonine aldolase
VLCLRAACRPWDAVICTETAHLSVDECGAPEAIAGVKLITVPSVDGKLDETIIEGLLGRLGDEHAVQPRVVSVSQCTELGTVYAVAELASLARVAHERGLLVHVDGARLANAAAALGVSLRAISTDAGVDMLSFGGTKIGLMGAEAVVFLDPQLADGFAYLRKQSMQLASKMRFLSAQLDALLRDELWLRCAGHANEMASLLAERVRDLPGVTITRPVQANAVFAALAPEAIASLRARYDFYVWDEAAGEVRWMCSWDTTPEDVEGFAAAVAEVAD